jgi:uncharacterized protein YceH (UPF0502 family)
VPDQTFEPLSPPQARVLGVLIEKQAVTPDNYPLTVNALTAGCNQKTSRHPVMDLSEAEVQAALEALKRRTLAIESYGASGRVLRYAHNFPKVFNVGSTATALLAVLMLRGPQTPGELRLNCDRMHKFADISSVEAYLEELAARTAGALTVCLPKQPGAREHRWAQLLTGPVSSELEAEIVESAMREPASADGAVRKEEVAPLRAEVNALNEEVAALRTEVNAHKEEVAALRTEVTALGQIVERLRTEKDPAA